MDEDDLLDGGDKDDFPFVDDEIDVKDEIWRLILSIFLDFVDFQRTSAIKLTKR